MRTTGKGLSLLVPYRSDGGERDRNWDWLTDFYSFHLPDAEICLGASDNVPFSRNQAINDAASRATGDVFCFVDADFMIDPMFLQLGANIVRDELEDGDQVWLHPAEEIFYLTKGERERVIGSDPEDPYWPPDPVPWHRYVQRHPSHSDIIMPRQCFEEIDGLDERFQGWGCADLALTYALKILWGQEIRLSSSLMHLWHPIKSDRLWRWRRSPSAKFEGQDRDKWNTELLVAYEQASFDPFLMHALVQSGHANVA